MSARDKTLLLLHRLHAAGINANFGEAETLRRAELTLQKWAEDECGDSSSFGSWSIERDEKTGTPYRCFYGNDGTNRRTKITDREAGALRRVKKVCDALKVHFFHQSDPRGCVLYVSTEDLSEGEYTRGVACCEV